MIKTNTPFGDCPVYSNDLLDEQACDCDPRKENPCGKDSDCINRMLLLECCPTLCPAGEKCGNQQFQHQEYPDLIVKSASSKGSGLYAKQDLKKGDFVIEYVGELISTDEFKKRIDHNNANNKGAEKNCYYMVMDNRRVIDAGDKGNVARFMNHSCNPNCESQKWTVNGDIRIGLFALKDVQAGTELNFNYQLEAFGESKTPCMCGADNCSGFIGEKPIKRSSLNEKAAKKKQVKIIKEIERVWNDYCFRCFDSGKLLKCDSKHCPKVYHLSCVEMDRQPREKWLCPWHHCVDCGKTAHIQCLHCPNAYCKKHDTAVKPHPQLGLICDEHLDDFEDILNFYKVINEPIEMVLQNPNIQQPTFNVSPLSTSNETVGWKIQGRVKSYPTISETKDVTYKVQSPETKISTISKSLRPKEHSNQTPVSVIKCNQNAPLLPKMQSPEKTNSIISKSSSPNELSNKRPISVLKSNQKATQLVPNVSESSTSILSTNSSLITKKTGAVPKPLAQSVCNNMPTQLERKKSKVTVQISKIHNKSQEDIQSKMPSSQLMCNSMPSKLEAKNVKVATNTVVEKLESHRKSHEEIQSEIPSSQSMRQNMPCKQEIKNIVIPIVKKSENQNKSLKVNQSMCNSMPSKLETRKIEVATSPIVKKSESLNKSPEMMQSKKPSSQSMSNSKPSKLEIKKIEVATNLNVRKSESLNKSLVMIQSKKPSSKSMCNNMPSKLDIKNIEVATIPIVEKSESKNTLQAMMRSKNPMPSLLETKNNDVDAISFVKKSENQNKSQDVIQSKKPSYQNIVKQTAKPNNTNNIDTKNTKKIIEKIILCPGCFQEMPISKIGDHIVTQHSNLYVKDLETEVTTNTSTTYENTNKTPDNNNQKRKLDSESNLNQTAESNCNLSKVTESGMSSKESNEKHPSYTEIFTSTPNTVKKKPIIIFESEVSKPIHRDNNAPAQVNIASVEVNKESFEFKIASSEVVNKPRSSLPSNSNNLSPASDACIRCSAPGI